LDQVVLDGDVEVREGRAQHREQAPDAFVVRRAARRQLLVLLHVARDDVIEHGHVALVGHFRHEAPVLLESLFRHVAAPHCPKWYAKLTPHSAGRPTVADTTPYCSALANPETM